MNELCLANLTVGDAGPLELIDAAAAGGFDSVNLWLVEPPAMAHFAHFKHEVTPVVANRPLIDAIRRRCEERGVRVFTASASWLGPTFDEASIVPVMETLVALGARSISLVCWDPDRERFLAHFRAVCAAAARHALDVHLEFMEYAALKTLDEARDFIRLAAQPNARIIVDALHLDRSGGTPAGVQTLEPRTIASVQLCDAPKVRPAAHALRDESVNARLLPGEGELPLFALMDALPKDVVIELETPDASLAHLTVAERAVRCGGATRRFLERYHAR
ncbi:MAG TPA: TIM barrel protein [Candidatus Binatia bacterium]|nr:TIM barrel protein [Candidatus Binatia bacterium]